MNCQNNTSEMILDRLWHSYKTTNNKRNISF